MAQNFLQDAASWLGKLFAKKRQGDPLNDTAAQSGGSPPPVYTAPPPTPKSPIGLEDPEIQRLMGGITDAQGVLSRPMPKLQEAKPDPLEQILSVVLAGTNKYGNRGVQGSGDRAKEPQIDDAKQEFDL